LWDALRALRMLFIFYHYDTLININKFGERHCLFFIIMIPLFYQFV